MVGIAAGAGGARGVVAVVVVVWAASRPEPSVVVVVAWLVVVVVVVGSSPRRGGRPGLLGSERRAAGGCRLRLGSGTGLELGLDSGARDRGELLLAGALDRLELAHLLLDRSQQLLALASPDMISARRDTSSFTVAAAAFLSVRDLRTTACRLCLAEAAWLAMWWPGCSAGARRRRGASARSGCGRRE